MLTLASKRQLDNFGLLSMNCRNLEYISRYNKRSLFPLVDNKFLTKQAALAANIAVPELIGSIQTPYEVNRLEQVVADRDQFVIKPARGRAGKGILVISRRDGDRFCKPSGSQLSLKDLKRDISNILSGLYSLGGKPDIALIESLIEFDEQLARYTYQGVPDIRVIVFKGDPVMAMLRCSTAESDGKAAHDDSEQPRRRQSQLGLTNRVDKTCRRRHARRDTIGLFRAQPSPPDDAKSPLQNRSVPVVFLIAFISAPRVMAYPVLAGEDTVTDAESNYRLKIPVGRGAWFNELTRFASKGFRLPRATMLLLSSYVLLALVFSFLCSIAEAVILSVTRAHIALLEQEKKSAGPLLRALKEEINQPLAAILTLNTITHTVGAAGAGAQAAVVFGSAYVGVASAVLTLLILIFSEIIPKTLGANYWRTLAPATAYGLRLLIWLLYPFVKLSEKLTRRLGQGPNLTGFSRSEFAAMADVSVQEGELAHQESQILKNLLRFREMRVKDAMTPRTVMFSLPDTFLVQEYFHKHDQVRFSRVPIFSREPDHVSGFVLRSDLLLAQARGNSDTPLKTYHRGISSLLSSMSLSQAFDEFLRLRAHIMLVVDEYGGVEGILTLEDLLETLLGLEIVDEGDTTEDMQKLARRLWKRRAREMGLKIHDTFNPNS